MNLLNVITTLLVAISLTLFGSFYLSPLVNPPPKFELEPLDESQIMVHWIDEGEPAPFDGILMSDYSFERIRLKLLGD